MDDMHFSFKIENPPAWLPIGRTAENDWRTIEIDCSYWFNMDATGNVVLMYRPSCGMAAYPLLIERDGENIVWHPKSGELVEGVGQMQAFFYVGESKIGSSEMVSCEVDGSLLGGDPGTDPGAVAPPWAIDIIEQIAVLSGHYPKIVDGDLYIWDSTLNDWVEFETGGDVVDSVNGKTGVVVLDASDVGALPNTYTAPVQSVNGQTGAVVLGASDVHALPDSTVIPPTVTEQTVAGWGFTKNTGTYSKPSGGIPASDLASGVIPIVPLRVSAESIGITTSDETGVKNSEALNAYIAGSSDAKTVHFKSGNYKFSNTVNITTSTNFAGDGKGTVLEFTGDGIFLNSTIYFAPNFYNMTIKGPGNGLGLKIGDKSISSSSCRGVLLNVHMCYFDVAIEVSYGWGWLFLQLGAQNINDWLFHVTGVWNTSNVIGGEYEYQSGGGVFWDNGSGSVAVNFIGIIWESLTSHVFKVDDNAANISVNIEGAYFENSKEYNDQVSTAHLIYSNNPNAVFNFIGKNNIGYYQVIKSAGLVSNPPSGALLALGGYKQQVVLPNVRLCAVQSPDYRMHHGAILNLEGKTYYTKPDEFDGSIERFLVDELGTHFIAYNASWTTYKNQFDTSTPVRQIVFYLPENVFNLKNIDIGFEFVIPSNFDWSTVVGGLINLAGVTGGGTNTTPFDRYIKMLGDVTSSYNRYQYFRYFHDAEVSAPTVTIGNKNYYELQFAVSSAEVIVTKVFIDDGQQNYMNKLIDVTTSGEKQMFKTIDQNGSIYVSENGGITDLVLHGKTSTATGKNLCSLGTVTWTGVKDFTCDPIPAGTYYFSGIFSGGNPSEGVAIAFYNENGNNMGTKSIGVNSKNSRTGFSITFSAPCTKIALYAANGWGGAQGYTGTWYNIQIEEGSTFTSYEPYGATGDIGIEPIVKLGIKTLFAVGVSQLFDDDSFDFVNCTYYKASDNTTTPAAINGSVNKVVGNVEVSAGGDVFVGYFTDQ